MSGWRGFAVEAERKPAIRLEAGCGGIAGVRTFGKFLFSVTELRHGLSCPQFLRLAR